METISTKRLLYSYTPPEEEDKLNRKYLFTDEVGNRVYAGDVVQWHPDNHGGHPVSRTIDRLMQLWAFNMITYKWSAIQAVIEEE